jgi:hypothetical protein
MMTHFPTFLNLKRLQWAVHVVRRDDSCIPQKVMGGYFGGRRPVGKPRGRRENTVWQDALDFLQTEN